MNIVCRPGGFHTMMSFMGSIGFMMKGSGVEEALETGMLLPTLCEQNNDVEASDIGLEQDTGTSAGLESDMDTEDILEQNDDEAPTELGLDHDDQENS